MGTECGTSERAAGEERWGAEAQLPGVRGSPWVRHFCRSDRTNNQQSCLFLLNFPDPLGMWLLVAKFWGTLLQDKRREKNPNLVTEPTHRPTAPGKAGKPGAPPAPTTTSPR